MEAAISSSLDYLRSSNWKQIFRRAVAIQFKDHELLALRDRMQAELDGTDNAWEIVQNLTVNGFSVDGEVRPAETCPVSWLIWKYRGCDTVSKVEEEFAHVMEAVNVCLGDGSASVFLNYVDNEERDVLFRELVQAINEFVENQS